MSFAAQAIIELEARLALACEALNAARPGQPPIRPEDVQLDDLDEDARHRLVVGATDRFWQRMADAPRAPLPLLAKETTHAD